MQDNDSGEPSPTNSPVRHPIMLFQRLVGALFLRPDLYGEVAADPTATRQAVAVVCLSALAQRSVLIEELGAWALPIMMAFGLIRWCIFSGITYGVGRLVSGKPISFEPLLRCLGFAEVPAIFTFVVQSLEPPWSMYLGFVVWSWLLAAAVVGVHAALRVGPVRAAVIAVLSFAFYLSPGFLFG